MESRSLPRSLPRPSHVLKASWNEVTKKVIGSTVFIDDEMCESLHWHGGAKKLMKAGAKSIKSFSSFEDCESTKAVFLISSVIQDVTEKVLKDIISGSDLTDVCLICGAHPSVQAYAKYPSAEDIEDKQIVANLEMKVIEWIGKQNASVEIYPYPLLLLHITNGVFVLPKFKEIFPILESDILDLVQGEHKLEMDLSRLEFSHLPHNLRVDIRHLIVFFHNLFSAMNVREEIFSLGETSGIIASELDTYNPARLRRRTAESKISLVLVDRTLDLVQSAGHRTETLFDLLLRCLPRFPQHTVDSRIDMRPLTDIHSKSSWTLLPGCFSHPEDIEAEEILETSILSDEKKAMKHLETKFAELCEDETADVTFLSKIKKLSNDEEKLVEHMNIIQQGLGAVEATSSAASSHANKVSRYEKMLQQAVFGQQDAFVETCSLITNRGENGLNLDDILCLLFYVASLSGSMDATGEQHFLDVMSTAIVEDSNSLPDAVKGLIKGSVDELSALKAAKVLWKKLLSVSNARKKLKNYQSLYTETTDQILGSFKSLLSRLIDESLSNSNAENSDLEYKSSGLKNMIKTGFSLFVKVSKPTPREAEMMIVYVVGGITSAEVAEIKSRIDVLKPNCEVIISSSHFTYPKNMLANVLQEY